MSCLSKRHALRTIENFVYYVIATHRRQIMHENRHLVFREALHELLCHAVGLKLFLPVLVGLGFAHGLPTCCVDDVELAFEPGDVMMLFDDRTVLKATCCFEKTGMKSITFRRE